MTQLAIVVFVALALWWLFLTPAKLPRKRLPLGGVGSFVYSLASYADGSKVRVTTLSGVVVCEFERQPDTGGVEQDVRMRVPQIDLSAAEIERIHKTLEEAGLAWKQQERPEYGNKQVDRWTEVALFGRREDLGLEAIRAVESVVAARLMSAEAPYNLELLGGYPDSALWRRLNEDSLSRPDAAEKAQRIMASRQGKS